MNNPGFVTLLVFLVVLATGAVGYLTGSAMIFKWSLIGGLVAGVVIVITVVFKTKNKPD